jgi:hypothetical protein
LKFLGWNWLRSRDSLCPISQIDIHGESHHGDPDTPVLHAGKGRVKKEDIEEEIIHHGQVSKHLQFRCLLVLESHELGGLGSDDGGCHAEEDDPFEKAELQRVVEERLTHDKHH